MARNLTNKDEIDNFVSVVIDEAIHHASGVARAVPRLAEIVLSRFDFSKDKFSVYERKGNLARTCWVTLSGKRYAFSYNYSTKMIELKEHSIQGDLIASFNNNSSDEFIKTVVLKM